MDVDPNDYLAEIREALRRYEEAENPGTWEDDCQSDAQRYASDDAARVLVSYLGPLDGWLTLGGRLPDAWARRPLSERAPEVGALLAALGPGGSWGSDELGTLVDWFTLHGYDVGPGDDDDGQGEPYSE